MPNIEDGDDALDLGRGERRLGYRIEVSEVLLAPGEVGAGPVEGLELLGEGPTKRQERSLVAPVVHREKPPGLAAIAVERRAQVAFARRKSRTQDPSGP